jgi:hypothetical protein
MADPMMTESTTKAALVSKRARMSSFGLLDELENVFWATGTGIGAVERLCVEVKLVYEGLDGEVVAEEEETGGDSDNCEDSCEEPPVVAREEQAFFQEIEERWGGALPGCHGWMLELAS